MLDDWLIIFMCWQSSQRYSGHVQNPYSSKPRGLHYKRSAMGGRVIRASMYPNSPCNRGSAPQHRSVPRTTVPRLLDKPQLHFTISNCAVEEPTEQQQYVVELPAVDCVEGGDFARQPRPAACSVPRQQNLAPAVAQLFSSVSQSTHRSTRDYVSELLDVHPEGIALNDFFRVFETCFHRPFDSRCTDVTSLRQMLEHMVDIAECVERGNEVIVRKKDGCDFFRGNALHVSAVIV